MNFEIWYRSKYPYIASGEDFAMLQAAWEAATKAEREACVNVCEGMSSERNNPYDCANAIRRRSN